MASFPPTFTVVESHGLSRCREPVLVGMPLSKGWVGDPGQVGLATWPEGRAIPCQCDALARWSDGSIRWLLVAFLADVPARGQVRYALRRVGVPRSPGGMSSPAEGCAFVPLRVVATRSHFLVDTGVAEFEVPRGVLGPLSRVRVHGQDVIAGAGCWVRLVTAGEATLVPRIQRSSLEHDGPIRAVVRLEGTFAPDGRRGGPVRFAARLEFFAGLASVRLDFGLHNPAAAIHAGGLWDLGDPRSFRFQDLSLAIQVSGGGAVSWTETLGATAQRLERGSVQIYQDSSGGGNWRSPAHVDARGVPAVSFQGYRVTVTAGAAEGGGGRKGRGRAVGGRDRRQETFGLRAEPWVQVVTRTGWVAAAVQHFWQNFPKLLEASSAGVRVGLFPRACPAGFELQGGEKKRHTVGLAFGGADRPGPPRLEHVIAPLHVAPSPDWVARSHALPWFIPEEQDPEQGYRVFVRNGVEGPKAFDRKVEQVDEYGWRHFGDVWADHEAVHSRAPFPLIAHFNNQYDLVFGAAWHYLGTGDPRWRRLMANMARHVIDIDLYHTDQDRAAYNHGLFWHTDHYSPAGTATHRTFSRVNHPGRGRAYGGGPSNEHNYAAGLLLYYWLTGDPDARDAVTALADWVVAMDDGGRTVLSLLDAGPTGWASQTGSAEYHRAGRGAGNSISVLLDGFQLTRRRRYLDKAEALIRRCVHPEEDIDALGLDEPEFRWSYLVFLQALGKYLECKLEAGERDYMYRYARASLLRFADWMVVHEVPYQEVLDKVLIPTETWPATDVRKSHVLDIAATFAPAPRREVFREKAVYFYRRALDDLLAYPTAPLTRPLTILMANGAFRGYFATHDLVHEQGPVPDGPFDPPEPFVPQVRRVRATVARHLGVTARELVRTTRDRLVWWERRLRERGHRFRLGGYGRKR